MEKYVHDVAVHNLLAPKQLVPIFIDLFHPTSVVDVGCGLGTFLRVFKENGVVDIFGLDGTWVNKSLLSNNISLDSFKEVDLEEEVQLNRRFDLAMCLEVAEHIQEEKADNLVSTLTNLSDTIIFSAAIPYQGGQNHVNEQWLTYWESLFNAHNYTLFDIIRPKIWDNSDVFFWYKQNVVVFAKNGCINELAKNCPSIVIRNIVHPDLYRIHCVALEECRRENNRLLYQIDRLNSGGYSFKKYIGMLANYFKLRLTKLARKQGNN